MCLWSMPTSWRITSNKTKDVRIERKMVEQFSCSTQLKLLRLHDKTISKLKTKSIKSFWNPFFFYSFLEIAINKANTYTQCWNGMLTSFNPFDRLHSTFKSIKFYMWIPFVDMAHHGKFAATLNSRWWTKVFSRTSVFHGAQFCTGDTKLTGNI